MESKIIDGGEATGYFEGEIIYEDVRVPERTVIYGEYDEPDMRLKMKWSIDGVGSRFSYFMKMDVISVFEEKEYRC